MSNRLVPKILISREDNDSFNIKFKRECLRGDGLPHFARRQMYDASADLGLGYGLEIVKIRGARIRQTVGLSS
jgi:hypothetical protein